MDVREQEVCFNVGRCHLNFRKLSVSMLICAALMTAGRALAEDEAKSNPKQL
jgi:hypothetical protein